MLYFFEMRFVAYKNGVSDYGYYQGYTSAENVTDLRAKMSFYLEQEIEDRNYDYVVDLHYDIREVSKEKKDV